MLARMSLLLTQGLLRSSSLQTGPATAAGAAAKVKPTASAQVVTVTELMIRIWLCLPLLEFRV
jgi:hypothetical protein